MLEPIRKRKTCLLAVAFGIATMLGTSGLPVKADPTVQTTQQRPVLQMQAMNKTGNGLTLATSDNTSRSQDLLLKARRALMGRDVASAERYVQEAKNLNVVYRDVDDRPEYVLPLINKYKEIEQSVRTGGMTDSVKRELAKNYLHQAEALRRCRDFDNAEALIMEAKNLNVVLDAQTVQSGMDIANVLQRVQDDKMALQAVKMKQAPQTAPLTNVSEGTKRQVSDIQQQLKTARQLMAAGQLEQAEQIGRQLAQVGVPEKAFVGGDSPTRLLGDIAIQRSKQNTVKATPAIKAQPTPPLTSPSNGYLYVKEGDAALRDGKKDLALKNYNDALRYAAEMDAQMVKYINDSIAKLNQATPVPATTKPVQASGINFNQAPQNIQSEISAFIVKTHQIRQQNPEEALKMLQNLRAELNATKLDASMKSHFSYSVDMAISDTNRFIEENGSMIALENRNKDVDEQIRQKRERELQIQNRLSQDVEKFNQLLEEGKYDEAAILAKKCQDYAPSEIVTIQMGQMARMRKQVAFNENLKETRESGWLGAMNDVESASVINVSDANPVNFGPLWEQKVKNRKALDTAGIVRSETDMKILEALNRQITLPFDRKMPLDTIIEYLRSSANINILPDEEALAEAGLTSDTLMETKLTNITMKNYLKHILEPYNLTYIVDSEVLKITSKSKRRGELKTRVYNVMDLVTDIPNFNGLDSPYTMEAQFNRAYNQVARRGMNKSAANTIEGLNNSLGSNTMVSPDIMAQIGSAGGPTANFSSGQNAAAGGAVNEVDLVTLITTVIDPESWTETGDPQFFRLNGSLVIRQTDENHEEIKDLLEKLRSLLDLQIAVEVRFITISDEYTEKIGVNFNASIRTEDSPSTEEDGYLAPSGKGIFGISTADTSGGKPFTDTLNIDFSQNSYGVAVPQFGSYDPSVGAQMGFAILSDIESYFFMSAAESDKRSNILQAPKVTMFNGQIASVYDYMQVPYVYTVIPVVGEFSVAQQPVVTVINEGQFMTVQAVASHDRRFVRMTVAPHFSTITDKDRTFKFDGTESSVTNSTSASKGNKDVASVTDERESNAAAEYVSSGTTIQEPITSMFTVQTTVKVPDGGTVLLGGIKRLSEGRNEAGVPILSKIPYLKRLFSNSAIGRETTSLMMMVTPRIIIQEEEEDFLMGSTNNI